MHVLITGAGGHLGRKLFDRLEADSAFEVSGLDLRAIDHPRIHTADLSSGEDWAEHFDGVDVIVQTHVRVIAAGALWLPVACHAGPVAGAAAVQPAGGAAGVDGVVQAHVRVVAASAL
jgi:nucleoside-diphosphate-sugar epimerase